MKTVTLETARALREVGYRQETELCYIDLNHPDGRAGVVSRNHAKYVGAVIIAAAPTAGELLEWFAAQYIPVIVRLSNEIPRYGVSIGRRVGKSPGGRKKPNVFHDNPDEALGLLALRVLKETVTADELA